LSVKSDRSSYTLVAIITIRGTDRIDRQIIALLQINARESTTTIAKKLGVARTTVHERIARLERSGTIQGYSVVLNRNPFEGYSQAHVFLRALRHKQPAIVDQLKRMPEVKVYQAVSGDHDLLCLVEVRSLEEMDALLVEISSVAGVEKAGFAVVVSTKFDRRVGASPGGATARAAASPTGRGAFSR
jgi:DNA-binding Lrp family transcriptional regulator